MGRGRDAKALHAPCVRRAPRPSGRPNRHARLFRRHQRRRLPPRQLGHLPRQAAPDRREPRTRPHRDVLRWTRRTSQGGGTPTASTSLGRDIENREIQTTIQGQTISSNFGIPKSGIQPGIAVHGRGEEPPLRRGGDAHPSEDEALLDELGTTSYDHYLALRNRPEFTDYLATFGTLKYYEAPTSAPPHLTGQGRGHQLRRPARHPVCGFLVAAEAERAGLLGLGTPLKPSTGKGASKKPQASTAQRVSAPSSRTRCSP